MKKIFKALMILVCISLLASCSIFDREDENMNSVRMTARVIAVNDRIEVEVVEGEYGASGTYWVILGENASISDANGKPINASTLSAGDIIEIIYNGQVMMSYPPQIVARSITLK